jgi:hypothetical protein
VITKLAVATVIPHQNWRDATQQRRRFESAEEALNRIESEEAIGALRRRITAGALRCRTRVPEQASWS